MIMMNGRNQARPNHTKSHLEFVEMLPNIEPDDHKSIPSAEFVLPCVEKKDNFLYPWIISDEAMDTEEEEFDLDMMLDGLIGKSCSIFG